MVSRPTGTIMAPPPPCRTRQATSTWMLVDIPQRNEPKVNRRSRTQTPAAFRIDPPPAADGNEDSEAQCVADSTAFMLSGATLSASAMAGTAVFKIVVSSDSMKNATATSHGNSRLLDVPASR
jgi:hypothetical protein